MLLFQLVVGVVVFVIGVRDGHRAFDPRTPRSLRVLNVVSAAALVLGAVALFLFLGFDQGARHPRSVP